MALNDDGSASATITAENTFTDAVPANGAGRHRGTVTIVGESAPPLSRRKARTASMVTANCWATRCPTPRWKASTRDHP